MTDTEHVHHWRTETPTGGRMKCECGALYVNGVVIGFTDDDEIVFVGQELPNPDSSFEATRQAKYQMERERLMEHPGEWATLVQNLGSRGSQVSPTSETTRRRMSAKAAGVGDKFRFAQRITYRNPDNWYDTISTVFGRYYPNGIPK